MVDSTLDAVVDLGMSEWLSQLPDLSCLPELGDSSPPCKKLRLSLSHQHSSQIVMTSVSCGLYLEQRENNVHLGQYSTVWKIWYTSTLWCYRASYNNDHIRIIVRRMQLEINANWPRLQPRFPDLGSHH